MSRRPRGAGAALALAALASGCAVTSKARECRALQSTITAHAASEPAMPQGARTAPADLEQAARRQEALSRAVSALTFTDAGLGVYAERHRALTGGVAKAAAAAGRAATQHRAPELEKARRTLMDLARAEGELVVELQAYCGRP